MALDPVPWFVGGGAEHSPEVARLLAYAASGGAEGITASTDFLVTTTPTPSTSVRVAAGSATLLNKYAGGAQQAYMARASTVTDIAVAATGSSGGRSDMVVLRIDDPQYGGQAPADPKVGPYVRIAIIQGVAAGSTTVSLPYPAIPLARIDLPANTGTVLANHIIDVRKVARPLRTRDLYNTQPTATSTITSGSWTDWTPQANRTITVPSWATQAKIIAHVASVAPASSATLGVYRVMLGSLAGQQNTFDLDASTRATLLTGDTFTIPASMRGTNQIVKLQAARSSGAGNVKTDTASTVILDVEFLQVASVD